MVIRQPARAGRKTARRRWHALVAAVAPGRRRARTRGQSLVELALILPVFLLLFVAALDAGRLFYSQITLANAAQQEALEAASDAFSGSLSFQAGQPCNATTNRVTCRAVNESQGSFVTVAPADIGVARVYTRRSPDMMYLEMRRRGAGVG